MKKISNSEINHNLVMFPSSKNFKINTASFALDQDPLHHLIHEFSDAEDCQIPFHEDDRFEFEGEESYSSLEAFMNRQQGREAEPHFKLVNERLEAIKEAKARMKYYLDDIDMLFPGRK